ncbi:MAG: phosphoribosyl-AMP cyclohydrolase [Lentilitoribacter sp.]
MKRTSAVIFDPENLTFDERGLLPVVAQDATSKDVLMLAWMNAEAVRRTLETKRVTYWSRSRSDYWIKGETSGNTQELVDFRFDCDRDCLLVLVNQIGPACHTGAPNCFFTAVRNNDEVTV